MCIRDRFYPELKGPSIYKTGKGEGTNAVIAAQRSLKHALKQVKGKRVTIIKATITITEMADAEPLIMEEANGQAE